MDETSHTADLFNRANQAADDQGEHQHSGIPGIAENVDNTIDSQSQARHRIHRLQQAEANPDTNTERDNDLTGDDGQKYGQQWRQDRHPVGFLHTACIPSCGE